MCKQGEVQNLSQKQAPNHLVQVKNQLKQVDLGEVDLSFFRLNTNKKEDFYEMLLFLYPL